MGHFYLKTKSGKKYLKRDSSKNAKNSIGVSEVKTQQEATSFNEKELVLIIKNTKKKLVKIEIAENE